MRPAWNCHWKSRPMSNFLGRREASVEPFWHLPRQALRPEERRCRVTVVPWAQTAEIAPRLAGPWKEAPLFVPGREMHGTDQVQPAANPLFSESWIWTRCRDMEKS